MLNIIYTQPLQESKDDISNQPCMTAYLSFVTIFNTIYQRKTGFQKTIPFVKNAREVPRCRTFTKCTGLKHSVDLAVISSEGLYLATLNHVDIFTVPHISSPGLGLLKKLSHLPGTWLSQFLPSHPSILTNASGTS